MTDLAALADEMPPREVADRLEYLSRAYDTFAASGDYVGMGDYGTAIKAIVRTNLSAILAALRASRPEPAADAVEAAYREGYRTCWHFNVATDDPADEEIIGIEWRDSKARAALAALLAPVSTDEQVDQAAVRIADATLCQWGRPNDCGREGEPCLCEVAAKAALAASRGQDHALAARTACSNGGA